MTAAVASPEAVSLVEVTARSRRQVYTRDEVARAALLVDGCWAAGRAVGVEPADWAAVASLGHECLDAVRRAGDVAAAGGGR